MTVDPLVLKSARPFAAASISFISSRANISLKNTFVTIASRFAKGSLGRISNLRLLRTRLREVDISSKIQLPTLETHNRNLMKSNKLDKI